MLEILWSIAKVYLICGVVYMILEWAIIAIDKKRLLRANDLEDAVCEIIAYLYEIIAWPWHFFGGIIILVKLFTGRMTFEKLEEIHKKGDT